MGAGYWGTRHADALIRHPSVGAVHIWDPDPHAGAALRAVSTKCHTSPNLEVCLDRAEAVIISSPAASHGGIATRSLERRLPTLMEKPVGVSAVECRDLFASARAWACFLGGAHQYEHHLGVERLREWYSEAHARGPVRFASTRIGGRRRDDVDVLLDLAVHDVAILNRVVGRACEHGRLVEGSRADDGQLVAATIEMTYGEDVVGQVRVAWDGSRERCLRLEGVRGTAVLDETPPASSGLVLIDGVDQVPLIAFRTPLEAQCDYFLRMAKANSFSSDEEARVLAVMTLLESLDAPAWRAA
ncbi:MAG: Gfo/Idh/MocA family protein [Nocardioidaceae bacterium]